MSKHHELALTGQVTLGWDHQPGYSSVKPALHSRNPVYFLTALTVNEWFLLSVKSLTAKVCNGIFCKASFLSFFSKASLSRCGESYFPDHSTTIVQNIGAVVCLFCI